ncbi:MAG TPA: Lrp/AsnC family transcriptional regulator [Oligoflexia bacterium]|nr:Lrp/AsnC family transcriptional regulator [Oligoflexia bacterium]
MTASMDLFDRRILFELDCDSRRSLSDIARKVRLGRDLVSYRIERLRHAGILNKCTVMINPYKLGLTVYKTYLKLDANKGRWNEFVAYLDHCPYTAWLAECYGKWDVIWCVYARSPKEVYDLQDRLFSDFRDIILAYNVCTLVNYWSFPKKHLIGQSAGEVREWAFSLPEFTFGATPLEHRLDEIEYGIVQLLGEDAQQSCVEIAKRLGTTPAVVKYRTEKLEELGVINGYRVDIDRSALGMTLFRVQVFPREYDAAQELEFHRFCQSHPQISCYEQQLGDCKLEFEVEAHDYAGFSTVIDDVRSRFSRYLRTVEYMMVRKDYFHRTPCSVFVSEAHDENVLQPPADYPALLTA